MNDTPIDPLADLPTDVPHDVARDHVAALVKGNGIGLDAANAALASRGAAPLAANSRDVAEASRDALLSDDNFRAAYLAGNPDAVAKLFQADLRVQGSSGNLTDRAPAASDYDLGAAKYMPNAPVRDVLAYTGEIAALAAALQLPREHAKSLVEENIAAMQRERTSTPEQRVEYGHRETAVFHSLLGTEAEARIKTANDTLSRVSGRKLDLGAIAHSNGCGVAINLLHQAEVLARRPK